MQKLLILLFFIAFTSSKVNTEVVVYSLPFDSNFYVDISAEKIATHSKVTVKKYNYNDFAKKIDKAIRKLDAKSILNEYRTVDTRLLIHLNYIDGTTKDIAFDKFGEIQFQGNVYKNSALLSSILKEYIGVEFIKGN